MHCCGFGLNLFELAKNCHVCFLTNAVLLPVRGKRSNLQGRRTGRLYRWAGAIALGSRCSRLGGPSLRAFCLALASIVCFDQRKEVDSNSIVLRQFGSSDSVAAYAAPGVYLLLDSCTHALSMQKTPVSTVHCQSLFIYII